MIHFHKISYPSSFLTSLKHLLSNGHSSTTGHIRPVEQFLLPNGRLFHLIRWLSPPQVPPHVHFKEWKPCLYDMQGQAGAGMRHDSPHRHTARKNTVQKILFPFPWTWTSGRDRDLLVVNKAAGIPFHPSQGNHDMHC